MKKVLGTMVAVFFIAIWPFGGFWYMILNPIMDGGVDFSLLCPIYIGIVLLAGIMVGCTSVICKKLDELRMEIHKDGKDENTETKSMSD